MLREFVNRREELGILEKLWRRKGLTLVLVYGRRRVGKTRLLEEFSREKERIFVIFEDKPREYNFKLLSRKVSEFVSLNVKIKGRSVSFCPFKEEDQGKGLLILDKFSYFIKKEARILRELSNSNWGEQRFEHTHSCVRFVRFPP